MITLNDLTINKRVATPLYINEKLKENGILLIDKYLEGEELKLLQKEYGLVLNDDSPYIEKLDYPQGIGRNVNLELIEKSKYPTTFNIFSSSLMQKVADKYLGVPNYFNFQLYVAKDIYAEINDLNIIHYDKRPTLKFFIYLNNVTKENGAFECAPKSHKISQEIRKYYLNRGIPIKDLPNRVMDKELSQKLGELIPMEGTAGSMLVFDSDAYHRAGRVSFGKERHIMRGHCIGKKTPTFYPKRFTHQWFNEKGINPLVYIRKLHDRIKW